MGLKLTNNATSVLAGSITAVATSLSVQAGDGAKFPALAAGDWFPLTVVDGAGNYEIMRVTARAGDVFTVSRAQEGTAAAAFTAGNRADLRVTAAAFAEFVNASAALQAANNFSDVPNKPLARNNLGLGSAALASAGDFATAAQGANADTAVQPSYVSLVGHTGNYADLSGKPTLGSAAALSTGTSAGELPVLDAGGKFPLGVLPASGFISRSIITASATITIPAGATKARVRMCGAGRGSPTAGATIGTNAAGYLEKLLAGLAPGATLIATVPAATAFDGGDCILDSGSQTIATLTASGGTSTAAGSASGGDINIQGGPGLRFYNGPDGSGNPTYAYSAGATPFSIRVYVGIIGGISPGHANALGPGGGVVNDGTGAGSLLGGAGIIVIDWFG